MKEKEWFTKVEAFEQFVDFETIGRLGKQYTPLHNAYIPVEYTVMPIPKFRNYDKEDQIGTDFTHRSREKHTHSAIIKPSTMRPSTLSPAPGSFRNLRAIYNDKKAHNVTKQHRWEKYRRLSKSP